MNPDPIPSHWTDDQERLARRLSAPPQLLVACDFDGTLAPIALHPDAVELPTSAATVLRDLGAAPGVRLAIISGRALPDLQRRVTVPVDCFAGNHGLEMAGHGLDGVRAAAGQVQPRLVELAERLGFQLAVIPGVLIENKGFSLSIHYRQVDPAHWDWVMRTVAAAVDDDSLRIQTGHRVVEVLPAIAWDKGEALKQMAGRLGIPRSAVVYVGDDTTDEAAFRAIPNGTSVSVGEGRPSGAHWMARCPEDVCSLLWWLGALRS